MSINLESSQISLAQVEQVLSLQARDGGNFSDFLSYQTLTEWESQELMKIRYQFQRYLKLGKVGEGMIKFLIISPLLRLAGFFDLPVVLTLENSPNIEIEDQDTKIKGKLDILAMQYPDASLTNTPFWLLVVETKNSQIDALEGLPQLLTYTYKGLEKQNHVLGLTTNGISYRFVRLHKGLPPTYQILPEVNLIDVDRAYELLQVLKGICNLQSFQKPGF